MIAFCIAFNLYYVFYFGGRGIYLVFTKYKLRISHYFKKKEPEIDLSEISDFDDSILKKKEDIMPHVQGFVMEDGQLPKRRKKKFKELTEVQEVPEEEQKEDSADQPSVEAQGMNKTPKNKSPQRAPEEMLNLNPFYQMNIQIKRIE
jgi:hypothetical protein